MHAAVVALIVRVLWGARALVIVAAIASKLRRMVHDARLGAFPRAVAEFLSKFLFAMVVLFTAYLLVIVPIYAAQLSFKLSPPAQQTS